MPLQKRSKLFSVALSVRFKLAGLSCCKCGDLKSTPPRMQGKCVDPLCFQEGDWMAMVVAEVVPVSGNDYVNRALLEPWTFELTGTISTPHPSDGCGSDSLG
mmetsp:Transcript_32010/g.70533  ORF Transcript_32010/g.70533 Transcript_32010/m.70533 type:complete len:102 (-) Transcript_32010:518-823(-)